MYTLKMCSPGDCTVSGPADSSSHNSGKAERGLAHEGTGTGRQNKTHVTETHKSSHNPADGRDRNRAASLSQSVPWAPPGSLHTGRQGREMASGQAAFLPRPCPS